MGEDDEVEEVAGFDYMKADFIGILLGARLAAGDMQAEHETNAVTRGPEKGYETPREESFAVAKIGDRRYIVFDQVVPTDALEHYYERRIVDGELEDAIRTADEMIAARGKRTLCEERERFHAGE
jgi:hypothetical protein